MVIGKNGFSGVGLAGRNCQLDELRRGIPMRFCSGIRREWTMKNKSKQYNDQVEDCRINISALGHDAWNEIFQRLLQKEM